MDKVHSTSKLVATLTDAVGTCDGPAFDQDLFRSICERVIEDALEEERPKTIRDLAASLAGPRRRPGEGARLLRLAVRRLAEEHDETTVTRFASEYERRSA